MSRTSDRLASAADPDDVRLPIGLRFVKLTLQVTAFRDRGPRVLGSGNGGDQASLWKRNVAGASSFTFFHRETARQFRRRSRIFRFLRLRVEGRNEKEEEQPKTTRCALNHHRCRCYHTPLSCGHEEGRVEFSD